MASNDLVSSVRTRREASHHIQSGTQCHSTLISSEKWIGWAREVHCSAGPAYSFILRDIKGTRVISTEQLIARIAVAARHVPGILQILRNSIFRRRETWITDRGQHFERFL
ncbi:hypothetical protein AVEN_190636-1 [Araneus ventricosus]|uniref:Uncharacterized protein n=1 Tax=Araneus ventricosus TaxID=182803 RepID=A0A4Y2I2Q0_ARAVE|nr:hypothetical protein AVEN_190636-1 [Araneus ventricosus]